MESNRTGRSILGFVHHREFNRWSENEQSENGKIDTKFNFVANKRSQRTLTWENRRFAGEDTNQVWMMKISNNDTQTFVIYGIRFVVTKADGTAVAATWGSTGDTLTEVDESTVERQLNAPKTGETAKTDKRNGFDCMVMSQRSQIWYESGYLAGVLGVQSEDSVRLDITLDYAWDATYWKGLNRSDNRWGRFQTVEESGVTTYDKGFGFFVDTWGFQDDGAWHTTTISRPYQRLGVTGCNDWWFDTWNLNGDIGDDSGEEHDHFYIRGIRIVATVNGKSTTTAVWGTGATAAGSGSGESSDDPATSVWTAGLRGYTVTLTEAIRLDFYFDFSQVPEGATVQINGGTPTALSSYTKVKQEDGTEATVVSVTVPARSMTETQRVSVSAGGHTYSAGTTVRDYAMQVVNRAAKGDENYTKAAPLAKALLNYGAAAQTYFANGATVEHLANTLLGTADQTLNVADDALDSYGEYNHTTKVGDVTFVAANLALLSQTTLRLFFTAPDKNFTVTYGGKTLPIGQNGTYYYAEVTDITPDKLSENVTFTVTSGDKSENITYNVMAYGCNVLQANAGTYGALQNVMRALWLYNQAAIDYAK